VLRVVRAEASSRCPSPFALIGGGIRARNQKSEACSYGSVPVSACLVRRTSPLSGHRSLHGFDRGFQNGHM
jgi:hypothetical protein